MLNGMKVFSHMLNGFLVFGGITNESIIKSLIFFSVFIGLVKTFEKMPKRSIAIISFIYNKK